MVNRRPPSIDVIAQLVRDTPTPNRSVRAATRENWVLAYMRNVLRCLDSTAQLWLSDAATEPDSPVMIVHLGSDGVEDVLVRHADYAERHETDEYGPGWAFDMAPAATVPDLDLLWLDATTGMLRIRNPHRTRQVGGRYVLLREPFEQWRARHTQRIAGQRAVAKLIEITQRRRQDGDGDPAHLDVYEYALNTVRRELFAEPADNLWLPTLAGLYETSRLRETQGHPHQPTYRRALVAVAARVLDCTPEDARPLLEGQLPTTTPEQAQHGFKQRL